MSELKALPYSNGKYKLDEDYFKEMDEFLSRTTILTGDVCKLGNYVMDLRGYSNSLKRELRQARRELLVKHRVIENIEKDTKHPNMFKFDFATRFREARQEIESEEKNGQ